MMAPRVMLAKGRGTMVASLQGMLPNPNPAGPGPSEGDAEVTNWQWAYRGGRKVVVGVLGLTLVLIGLAMVVLPGPAFVVLPAGLAVLSLEFAFARRWLRRLRAMARRATTSARLSRAPGAPDEAPPPTQL